MYAAVMTQRRASEQGAQLSDKAVAADGRRVRDIVHDVVANVAPHELPLVDGLRRFDDETAVRRLRRGGRSDDPLGFGLGEVATLLTPVVWLTLDEAARTIVGTTVEGAAKTSKAKLRRIFRRSHAPVMVPALTREQLSEVRQSIMESSARNGVDQRLSETLADAVVARLALRAPEPADEPSGAPPLNRATGSGDDGGPPDPRA